MDLITNCNLMNSLLVDIHRSLLQYAVEASPWASEGDLSISQKLSELATLQDASVPEFIKHLRGHKFRIDFGVYPQEYTSLHFVGIDYFLDRLKESQKALLQEAKLILEQVSSCSGAKAIVETAIGRNEEILTALESIQLTSKV